MESVGRKLLQARSRLGLTVADVAARTRISIGILTAIENDQLGQVSCSFLYKSFVRQFAETVGLDVQELEPALRAAAETIPEVRVPGQMERMKLPKVPSLKPRRVRASRWVYSLILLLSMLVACSTLYWMWDNAHLKIQADVTLPFASLLN